MGRGQYLMLGRAGAWFVGQTHLGHLLVKLGAALSMETHTQYMLVGGKLALAPFPCPFHRADGKTQGEGCGEHFGASVPTLLMIWFRSLSGRSR